MLTRSKPSFGFTHAMRITPAILALLPLALAACGSSDPRAAGLKALQEGNYKDAAAALDKVENRQSDLEVALALCSALAHVDATRAVAEFQPLIAADKTKPADFSVIVGHLISAGEMVPAVTLMDAGMKKYPEDPKILALRDKVLEESKKSSDPAANEALKGLGYLGD